MINYAQIDEDGVCVGVSQLASPVALSGYIEISEMNIKYYLRRVYRDGAWTEETVDNIGGEDATDDKVSLAVNAALTAATQPLLTKMDDMLLLQQQSLPVGVEDDRQTANYAAIKAVNVKRLLDKGLIAKAIKTNGGF